MNLPRETLASMIRATGRALAGYAASQLLDSRPAAATVPAADPHAYWQQVLATQLVELAAALDADRPTLFANQVRWARAHLASRGVDVGQLRGGMESLRDVLHSQLPENLEPLAAAYIDDALRHIDEPPAEAPGQLAARGKHGLLAGQYLLALLEGEPAQASRLVFEALHAGHDVATLMIDVLLPSLDEIGRMWNINQINIAEEHLASTTTRRVMAQMMLHAPVCPANGKTIVAAAVPGNQHDIGVEVVGYFFEMAGWRIIPLGANVPTDDLVQAVDFFKADVIGLAVSLPAQLPALRETIQALRRSQRGARAKILVGGGGLAGMSELARELGADDYAADPAQAVALGNSLVGLGSPQR